jgi:tetratricopeptide (TPR) repeat protein
MRLADKQIESLRDSKGRELVGLADYPLSTEPVQRQKDLENLMAVVRTSKHHATYWIALTHFETGNYAVAVEWLRERVLAGAPDSPWHDGARYNLARSYEALGDWDKARQVYLLDESPQRHGNVLRATTIVERHRQQAEAEAENEPSIGQATR